MYVHRYEETHRLDAAERNAVDYILIPRDLTDDRLYVSFEREGKGGRFFPHSHSDAFHVVICTKGKGQIRVGGEIADVEAGMVVYIPEHAEHEGWNTGEGEFEFLSITVGDV